METKKNVFLNKMILAVVGRNIGEKVIFAVKNAGARGGTIVPARTTSNNAILQFLSLGDQEQDVVVILSSDDELDKILEAMSEAAHSDRKITGKVAVVNVSKVMRFFVSHGESLLEKNTKEDDTMNAQSNYEMISVIVNSGFADDVMVAARKAGATGGTILNARGTGTKDDVKFFGIVIVPEKEILMIVTEKEKTAKILEAIKTLECFSTPGSGICFCTDVEKFAVLGQKK